MLSWWLTWTEAYHFYLAWSRKNKSACLGISHGAHITFPAPMTKFRTRMSLSCTRCFRTDTFQMLYILCNKTEQIMQVKSISISVIISLKGLYLETCLNSPCGEIDLLFCVWFCFLNTWKKNIKKGWILPIYKLYGLKHNL